MKVRALAPLATSVLPWQGPDPHVTVVVGARFRLAQAALLLEHRPPSLADEHPGAVSPELWRTSDEVPGKSQPELLVVGHAFSPTPRHAIPVRIALGGLEKRFFAVAGAPCQHVPLSSTYLRSSPSGGQVVRVAPAMQRHAAWAQRRLSADVDFADFNAAPADQRLGFVAPGMPLVLEGTSAGQGRYEADLPHVYPVAFFASEGSPPATWTAVPLLCDTVWVDADGGEAVLVWRGSSAAPAPGTELVVAAGNRPLQAEELAAPAPPPPPSSPTQVPASARQTLDGDVGELDVDALPFDPRRASNVPPPSTPRARPAAGRATMEMDFRGLDLPGILPFDGPPAVATSSPTAPVDAPPPPSMPSPPASGPEAFEIVDEDTAIHDETTGDLPEEIAPAPSKRPRSKTMAIAIAGGPNPTGDSLPFGPGQSRGAPPPVTAREAQPAPRVGGETLAVEVSSLDASQLPFDLPPSMPAPPVVRPPNPAQTSAGPPAVAPTPPSEPPADEGPALVPAPDVPLATLARVKVALLDAIPLDAILTEVELDELTWRRADRKLAIDLAREASEERSSLSEQLEAAMALTERASPHGGDDEDHDFESYITIRTELEESEAPAEALEALGMPTSEWDAMRRRWAARAIADRAVANRIRGALADARRQLRSQRSHTSASE